MIPALAGIRVFDGLSWVLALAWFGRALIALRGMAQVRDLTGEEGADLPPLGPTVGPHLSVIVPACNEEAAIQQTLCSLLASTGLQFEMIAVDDRSTDMTGRRMDEVADQVAADEGPHRLRVIHADDLPAGWLGKPHAMALAAREATAPWLLFTDGDMIFHPRGLELAMREAVKSNADHLILVPTLIFKSAGECAMLAAMQALAQWTIRLWKVEDPRARDFFGVGGFNLVRREIYTQMGGFEGLRMEVLDDLRFGWKVKRAGYRQRVVLGPELVRIRWIDGALGVVRLIEKNGFAIYRYRVGLLLLACLSLAVSAILPFAAIAAGGWTMVAGLLTCFAIGVVYKAHRRLTQVSPWMAIFFAPATLIVIFSFLRSMILALVHNGVDWRGTRYALDDLRRNAGRGW